MLALCAIVDDSMTVSSLRMLFFALQVADILTTLLVFYLGRANPMVASILLGPESILGLIVLKVTAILITLRLESESVVNAGNLAYSGMLAWNVYVIWYVSTVT